MPTLHDALLYAEKGCSIIPIYPPGDNEYGCSCVKCPRPNNATKHPLAGLGSHDASKDERQLAEWWKRTPNANIGIVLGQASNDLLSFDVDDKPTAKLLLATPPQGYAVDQSPHDGCHIWFKGTLDQGEYIIKDTANMRLGELRGNWTYVVAPPSVNANHVHYTWRSGGPGALWTVPAGSPLVAVRQILAGVNRTMSDPTEYATGAEQPAEIPAIDAPAELTKGAGTEVLKLLLRGKATITDRSGAMYQLGMELISVAEKKHYALDQLELAGILKKADLEIYHKFSKGRHDLDKQSWICAGRTLEKVESRKQDGTHNQPPPPPDKRYRYAEHEGLLLMNARTSTKLANFKPEMLEEVTIEYGDDEQQRKYVIQLSRPGADPCVINLTPEEFSHLGKLTKAFLTQAAAGYSMEIEGYPHLLTAARALTVEVKYTTHYAQLGWIEIQGASVYLLPGMAGGIGADGAIEDLIFDGARLANSRILRYGLGVAPPLPEQHAYLTHILETLLTAVEPELLIPILTQVFAGPLTSWCIDEAPPVIHAEGRTGSLKTSLAVLCLSFFGQFSDRTVPDSWNSTINSLQNSLYLAKDITYMIDDYKEGTAGRNKVDASGFIQAFANGNTRNRLNRESEQRKTTDPRGLLLTTGEDSWKIDEASTARAISIKITRDQINRAKLKLVQDAAKDGWLAKIGGAYIQFLAALGKQKVQQGYKAQRDKIHEQLTSELDGAHLRPIATLATLFATERVLRKFIEHEFPELIELYKVRAEASCQQLIEVTASEAEESAELNPLNTVIEAVSNSLNAGDVSLLWFHDKEDQVYFGGGPFERVIGYFDEKSIYLGQILTYGWYEERCRARGTRPTFGWKAVTDIAFATGQGDAQKRRHKGNARLLKLPRTVLKEVTAEDAENSGSATENAGSATRATSSGE